MELSHTIADYLGAIRRRGWIFVLTVLIGSAVAGTVAYMLPSVYSSTAKILIERPQIRSDLAQETVSESAVERLDRFQRQLMTRDNLIEVIERLQLYSDTSMAPTEKVAKVRSSTKIESERNAFVHRRHRGPVSIPTFSITFEANDPVQAALVADEFASLVIRWNEETRNSQAAETKALFSQALERHAGQLEAIESQISVYKRENADALPDSLEFRRSELAALEVRIFDREQRRLRLVESKRTLEQALRAGHSAEGELSDDEKELQQLERELAQQSAVYKKTHPTMRKLSARIELLKQAIANAQTSGANVLRETEIKEKVALIDTQIALHVEQRGIDEAQRASLKASIAKTPEIEKTLLGLDRQRVDLQQRYDQAVLDHAQAETGEALEINQQGERFEIIEEATIPHAPSAPNRVMIAGGGVGASIALGIALMVLAELMSKPIRTTRDLQRSLDLRPVVTIPYIRSAVETTPAGAKAAVLLIMLVLGGAVAADWLPAISDPSQMRL